MDFVKPVNWGMKKFFPENMTVEDDANTIKITEKIAVQLAERVDDACASAIINEMGAEGYAGEISVKGIYKEIPDDAYILKVADILRENYKTSKITVTECRFVGFRSVKKVEMEET